jgi:hypothetical protein
LQICTDEKFARVRSAKAGLSAVADGVLWHKRSCEWIKKQVNAPMEIEAGQYKMSFSRPNEDTLLVRLAGNWSLGGGASICR